MSFLEDAGKLADNKYIIDSFFKTRVLGFTDKAAAAKKKGGKKQGANEADSLTIERVPVLMPVIDFLNHHSAAPGYMTPGGNSDGKDNEVRKSLTADLDGVMTVKSCPVPGSDETYVCYGPYEALDTLFNYNFVETYAEFVRSVPLSVKMPGLGVLDVRSATGKPQHKDLPEAIRDLQFYLPGIAADHEKKTVTMGFAYIPQEQAPRSLRRVLGVALRQLDPDLQQEELMGYIQLAEKRIVDENLKYFSELQDYLARYKEKPAEKTVVANARMMAKTQVAKIRNYPFFAQTQEKAAAKKRARG